MIFRRRCRCCPCPRSIIKIKCVGFAWKVTRISFYPIFIGSCKIRCIPIVFVYYKPIICPPRPRSHWTACVKCVQKWVYYVPVIQKCKCKYRPIVSSRTRHCCCNKPPFRDQKCVKGSLVTTSVAYSLEQFQCIKRKSVVTQTKRKYAKSIDKHAEEKIALCCC